jgi:histidinol dehydrogenase
VDKIFGPGNIWVTLAKRRVFGVTGIDAIYGPTETIVIADETADAAQCAADLLAQAEHDELAGPILITTSRNLLEAVQGEIERQIVTLERADVCRASLNGRGGAVVVETLEQAVELANEFAPEHLCLLVSDAWKYTALVRHAGGVFVGEDSPEVLGDYTAGPSHVMPTGGSARWSSPLSVNDFVKVISLVAVDRRGLERLGPHTAAIARAEGFTAHARAIEIRLQKG